MAKVIVYSKDYCPYCVKAKNLFKKKGVEFQEIDITHDAHLQEEMFAKAQGRRTVPQIFINNQPVGGCDDLYALEAAGKLDPLLA
ncbi:glutaredoxin 3 [Candidatus Paracaedibacter symbiosus]|uniref:glutaredoxin 3 n=1 Tax=Candidatus Paracaedibacter symbiosus TaxID=244582 RepID=UPI000509F203|nr:glutaredoxin 3 [Candidatus Paracaedibacter symbiosus]